MDLYTILAKGHGGMAMLTLLLALVSLALAVKAVLIKPSAGMKLENIAGLAETICAGVVTLSGIAVMLLGPWPLTALWLWAGLIIMVIYSILLKRFTKPARMAAVVSAKPWAGLQAVHVLLLVVGFGIMKSKGF